MSICVQKPNYFYSVLSTVILALTGSTSCIAANTNDNSYSFNIVNESKHTYNFYLKKVPENGTCKNGEIVGEIKIPEMQGEILHPHLSNLKEQSLCLVATEQGCDNQGCSGNTYESISFSTKDLEHINNNTVNISFNDTNSFNIQSINPKAEGYPKEIPVKNIGEKPYDIWFTNLNTFGNCGKSQLSTPITLSNSEGENSDEISVNKPSNDSWVCLRVQTGIKKRSYGPYNVDIIDKCEVTSTDKAECILKTNP